jgi:predicted RNase H-like HicB family nuclease
MDQRFTAVYQKERDWWVAWVEELPGANTQGATLEEARENLKEAVEMILEANRELAAQDAAGKEVVKEELLVRMP